MLKKYIGNIKKGKGDKKGIIRYGNGDTYIGQLKNYKMHGKGTMYYANGNQYKGSWKNNKKHGNGVLTLANGVIYTGRWIRGYKDRYEMKKTIPAKMAYNKLKNPSSYDYVKFIKKYPNSDITKNIKIDYVRPY